MQKNLSGDFVLVLQIIGYPNEIIFFFFYQIHFYEWQDEKECVVTIKDDSIFEGEETFYVELRTSAYTLIGQTSEVAVTIYDHEDGRCALTSRYLKTKC